MAEYIEKIRQKKKKQADAMSILVEENANKTKFVKTTQRNNLYAHPLTERNHVFITSLNGERVQH